MVDNVNEVKKYTGNTSFYSGERIPPLISAILKREKSRILNLLGHCDPNDSYKEMNAYEHATLHYINLFELTKALNLSAELIELHYKAMRIARRKKNDGTGPGVFDAENNFSDDSGPGTLV